MVRGSKGVAEGQLECMPEQVDSAADTDWRMLGESGRILPEWNEEGDTGGEAERSRDALEV